jgi:methyl-accepting chemotaxis protein
MTIAEIDAHPDADRIWSTIAAMQEGVKKLREDLKDAADEIRDFADRIESDAGQIASAMEKLK